MHRKEEVPVIPPEDIIIGNPDARITITEFIDYEDEKCVKAHQVIKSVMSQFGDKINFNFRHFPQVRIHQWAHKAAEAAIGAAQEGKFMEMHEILLQNRRHLGTTSLKNYAREAGATSKTFLNDLINSKYGWFVQDDLRYGLDMGVEEAPAILINGEKLEGNISTKNLNLRIKEALKKRKVKKAA